MPRTTLVPRPQTNGLFGLIRNVIGLDAGTWPPPDLAAVWEEIETFAAFRESDGETLRAYDGITRFERYLISPVPRLISRASANLLFGEAPEIKAENDSDETLLEDLIDGNDFNTELHRAAVISSSEGEIWGRLCLRPDLADVPVIEFVSRQDVIPHFAGRFVTGASFVTEWETGAVEVIRLFENYGPGFITNELYRGSRTSLGSQIPLSAFGPTQGMVEGYVTGIPEPLCAFIPNSIDSDPTRGYADYCGLIDRFLSINRASTIGDTNTELTGKKRALIDSKYVGRGGAISADDIFVRDSTQEDLDANSPLQILEYTYEADQIVTWLDHLIDSTLQFGGTSPQLAGRTPKDGHAVSGTALRFRMIHSLLEASGKGRYFDRGVRRLLRFAQLLDASPIGFGRGWTAPDEQPKVERKDSLPTDDLEASQELVGLVQAEAISVEQRVRFLHPEWSEQQITDEVKLLKDENKPPPPPPALPQLPRPGGGAPPPGGPSNVPEPAPA